MQGITLLKDCIEIDGEKYFHYTHNGKYKADKFIVWDGVHYYHRSPMFIEE